MRLSHTRPVVAASFDDPNLVSAAGLVPAMRLAAAAGLAELADEHLSVPTDKGASVGGKVSALVAGVVAGGTRSMTWRCRATAGCKNCSRRAPRIRARGAQPAVGPFVHPCP